MLRNRRSESFRSELVEYKIMDRTLSLTFGSLLVLFAWASAHSQSNTTKKDYKVVNHDSIIESGKKLLLTEYAFKGSTIKTREKYFGSRKEQDEGLAAETKNYSGCGAQLEIFNNTGTKTGRKIVCEDKPSRIYIIAYSHFDSLNKVYVIAGASRRIVEEFVTECPFVYHLQPDIECPGSD